MDNYLTVNEIAALLKVRRDTVVRWILEGKLRGFKLGQGRFWRVTERDFKRFVRGRG